MTYFPTQEDLVYKCPKCEQWFIQGHERCLVLHAPGTCCHYGDTPCLPPTPKQRENGR